MDRAHPHYGRLNEPFGVGRPAARLLSDFGEMLACFSPAAPNDRVLDFCSGWGWISEWLNRMGHEVWAIDRKSDRGEMLERRAATDARVDAARLSFTAGDAGRLPYPDAFFGHVCSFDSLHHMHDYAQTIAEMARVLGPGGRAVFVEPGAQHSRSPETLAFLQTVQPGDPDWIERDVVLEEIDALARASGFSELVIRPTMPQGHREYALSRWIRFREGDGALADDYLAQLKAINYDAHLVFYLEKPGA
jgi:SAM-dependent methyltransferase